MEGTISIILSILTALGGWEAVRYVINRHSERQKSDAEAAKEVQDVYQEMIADVKADREEQKTFIQELKDDRQHLREEREELRQRIDETEEKVRDLQREVARNGRMVEALRPLICGMFGCRNRKPVTVSPTGEIKDEEETEPKDIEPLGMEVL